MQQPQDELRHEPSVDRQELCTTAKSGVLHLEYTSGPEGCQRLFFYSAPKICSSTPRICSLMPCRLAASFYAEGADTAAFSATVRWNATLAAVEPADTIALAGLADAIGTLAGLPVNQD